MIPQPPSSPYETWVVTLRAWADDPSTPLKHLPVLTEESLPRDAYDRLFVHLSRALERAAQQWEKSFAQALSDHRDPHDLADRLVKLRVGLARRLQLASHPSLPESVRTSLTADFGRMVHRFQDEFESGSRRELTRRRLPQPVVEGMIRTIRENSLVGVLGLSITQDGSRHAARPLPESGAPPAKPVPVRRRRTLQAD